MRMKRLSIWYLAVLMLWPANLKAADSAAQPLLARAGDTSIHSRFVRAISDQQYESALAMLHPKLSREWTLARFTRDWAEIADQAASDWHPEMTGTFTGNSPRGVYHQATFRLVSDWQSITSVDLISMNVEGEPRIVRIHIRVPYRGAPPKNVAAVTDAFVASMLRGEYGIVRGMFEATLRQNYTPPVLGQLRPILGTSPESTSRSHYRLNANTVWYDAVRLAPPNDPMTFLELVMDSTATPVRIVSISSRGRVSR